MPAALRWAGDRVPGVRKIAVLRANAVGDFVLALPALDALRGAYPEAEIVLLGLAWHAEFLRDRPGPVDRVVEVPVFPGLRDGPEDPEAVARFFACMRDERLDLAMQLHGGGRHSNPFVRRLGARVTLGSRSADAEPLDRSIPYRLHQPEVLRYLEIVSLVGAEPLALEPRLAVTARDRQEAAAAVGSSPAPIVLLHPGARDPRRRWPAEKFARVADALAPASRILVNGVREEREVVEAVCARMQAPAVPLHGRLSLCGLVGVLASARLLVANDSGPIHLATALGTPVVGIYWCGNVIGFGPMTVARHAPHIAWRLDCPECGRHCMRDACSHQSSFVADVAVEDVLASARLLLGARPLEEAESPACISLTHA